MNKKVFLHKKWWGALLTLIAGSLFIFVIIGQLTVSSAYEVAEALPPAGSLTVNVFQDINGNATFDSGEAQGIANVTVSLFDVDDATGSACASTVTDGNGQAVISPAASSSCAGVVMRLEVATTDYPAGIVNGPVNLIDDDNDPDTSTYADSLSDASPAVQIIDLSTDQIINISAINPAEYSCGVEDAYTFIPCYVNGNPLLAGPASSMDAFVGFPYTATGSAFDPNDIANPVNVIEPDHLATAGDIGSTWGVAWSEQTRVAYTSAFLKRHVGLGPLGLDGIYAIDMSDGAAAASVSGWLEVQDDLGIDVGQGSVASNAVRGLDATADPSHDAAVFDDIAVIGMGDIDIVDDELLDPDNQRTDGWVDHEYLFVADLQNKDVLVIDAADKTLVTTYDIPAPTIACTNGEHRPWAVKYADGKLYVGMVCDASTDNTNLLDEGTNSNLEALVYEYDITAELRADTPPATGTVTPAVVMRDSLDYARGSVWKESSCPDTSSWHPWLDSSNPHPLGDAVPLFGPDDTERERICWPTPILSDIEFSDEGNMLMSFVDRTSHQWGFFNFGLDTNDDQTLYENMSGGDVLMACPNNTGTYDLENDGECGGLSSNADPLNAQGPGGREFFYADSWYFEIDAHNETANAGMAVLPGSGEVVVAGMNPWQNDYYSSGGVNWFSTSDGDPREPGYMLFASANSSSPVVQPGTQGKAGGLGDLEVICPAITQHLGDFSWLDLNQNGIQDPGEIPLAGVTVYLELSNGSIISTTTDANGFYVFNVDARTDYTIAFDASTTTSTLPGNADPDLLSPTSQSSPGSTPLNDSDISMTETLIVGGSELPGSTFTTANPGESNHDVDAGFALPYDLALVVLLESGQSPNVSLDETVSYEVVVKNQGSVNSGAFTTTVQIPEGMSFEAASGTGWSSSAAPGDEGTIILTFDGDLAPDAETVIALDLKVDSVAEAPFRVWAEISEDSSADLGTTDEDSTPDANTGTDPGPGTGTDPNDEVDNHNDIDLDLPPNDEDDNDFEDVVVNVEYDLALIKTLAVGQPALVAADALVDFVITVRNHGNVNSNDFVVTDQIPAGMSLVSATGTGWVCSTASASGTFTCAYAAGLAPDAEAMIEVQLRIDDASQTPFRNWAEISEDSSDDYGTTDSDSEPDSNTGNDNGPGFGDDPNDEVTNHNDVTTDDPADDEDDNDYEDVSVDVAYDLALINILDSAQSPSVQEGDNVAYNLIIRNQGNVDSGDFVVTNQIPEGMSFVSIDGTDWTTTAEDGDTGTVTFTFNGDLAPGETTVIDMVLQVDDATQAAYRDWAEISADSSADYNTTDEDSVPDTDVGDDNAPGFGDAPNDEVDNHDNISLDEPPNDEDDNDYADVDLGAVYDLALIKTLANSQDPVVSENDQVNYAITVKNQGNVDSGDFEVTEQIPAGMSFVVFSGTNWSCPAAIGATGTLTCTFGSSLDAGDTTVLNIVLQVDDASQAPFRNWAEISDDSSEDSGTTDEDSTPDTDTGNDDGTGVGESPNDEVSDHDDIDLDNPPGDEDDNDYADVDAMVMYDLALIKDLFPGQEADVAWQDEVSYVIRVKNQGTVNSGDFTVRETIPGGMSYVTSNGIDWRCNAAAGDTGNIICSFSGDLAPGEATLFSIRLSVDDWTKQPFRNWAEIATDSSEDYGVNDKDSVPGDNNGSDPDEGDGGTGDDPIIDHDDIDHDDPAYDDAAEDEDDSDYEDVTTPLLVGLGNLVWHDIDNDGQFEPDDDEVGIDGVTVNLLDANGNLLDSRVTANGGLYLFDNLPEGQYQLQIPTPPTAFPSSSHPTNMQDSRIDNDDNGDQEEQGKVTLGPLVTLTAGQEPTDDGDGNDLTDLTIDFGFFDPADGSTAVTLIRFVGASTDKTVTLKWETATEIDNFGFYIVRTRTADMPVDPDLRQALGPVLTKVEGGTGMGDSYILTDTVEDYGVYYYWLVDVETDGDMNIEEVPVRIMADRFQRSYLPLITR